MKKETIKRHFRNYKISGRKSTISHAFASALSIPDAYNDGDINKSLKILGQNPSADLTCAYCDAPANTWDHIFALVENGNFSGNGHQLFNLIPCCNFCNSKKGNLDWKDYLRDYNLDSAERLKRIDRYITTNSNNALDDIKKYCKKEIKELDKIKNQIFELMKAADGIAEVVRKKLKAKMHKSIKADK